MSGLAERSPCAQLSPRYYEPLTGTLVKRGEKWVPEKLGDSLRVTVCAGIEAWTQGLAVNCDIKWHCGHLLVALVSQPLRL